MSLNLGNGSGLRRSPLAGRARWTRGAGHGRVGMRAAIPKPLEAIELADARQHDMKDDVLKIDQDPLAVPRAFGAERPETRGLGFLDDTIRD